MTPQEQEMIDGLVDRIRKTQVTQKDTAAEQRLQQGLARYPDAVYVLAQTVLVQQYGLKQAQAQIETLKQQVQSLQDQSQQAAQTKSSGSSGGFLSHIFGGSSSQPASQPAPPSYQPVNNPGYGAQSYPSGGYPPPPPAYPPQGYPAPSSGGMFGGGGGGMLGGGGGGFLQGAMQTAAGVAAGEMMFQGMESLFHGFEHHGGGGFGNGLSGMGGGETVVNNYYDDDRGNRGGDMGSRDDSSFYNPSDDASRSDTADSGTRFADTGSDLGSNDTQDFSAGDDSAFDSGGFDNGGFDDNSGGDNGGGF